MITLPKLVKNNDKLYALVRTIPEHKQIDPKWFKYKLGTDHVFKAQGNYWFVNEIQEATIIPDTQYKLDFTN
jgi:hypothetical protein